MLYITDKKDLERSNKYSVFSNLGVYYAWNNVKGLYENNKFSIWWPTWDKGFEWPNWYYYISVILDYFVNIIKKHETITDKTIIEIYINKIKNLIQFKTKNRYYL